MTSTIPDRRRWFDWLKHRWPTALAIGSAALILSDGTSESANDAVGDLGEVLLLLPLLYLVVAKVQRRRASWPVLGAQLAVLIVLRALDVVAPATVFVIDYKRESYS